MIVYNLMKFSTYDHQVVLFDPDMELTTLGPSGPGSNDDERVLYCP